MKHIAFSLYLKVLPEVDVGVSRDWSTCGSVHQCQGTFPGGGLADLLGLWVQSTSVKGQRFLPTKGYDGSSNLRVMGWVSKPQFSQCCCEKSLSRSCLPSAIRGKSLREVTPSLPANVRRLAGDCDVQVPVVVPILLRDVVVKTS